MASNPDRVISKHEIIEKNWDGRIVSESTIPSCVKAARRAIGDNGQVQKTIKTAHGRGIRFVAKLRNNTQPKKVIGADIFVQPSLLILPVRTSGDDNIGHFGASVGEKLIAV